MSYAHEYSRIIDCECFKCVAVFFQALQSHLKFLQRFQHGTSDDATVVDTENSEPGTIDTHTHTHKYLNTFTVSAQFATLNSMI